jgi:hypothetical protein
VETGGSRLRWYGVCVKTRRLRCSEEAVCYRSVSSTACPLISTRGLHGWDLPATAVCRERAVPLFDRHIGQWCNQYLLVQPEQMRAISLGKAPLQRKHFERKRLEHDRHSRAGSFGKAPLQRQHFERYLIAQDEQSRATSCGNAPPQEQHLDCSDKACSAGSAAEGEFPAPISPTRSTEAKAVTQQVKGRSLNNRIRFSSFISTILCWSLMKSGRLTTVIAAERSPGISPPPRQPDHTRLRPPSEPE